MATFDFVTDEGLRASLESDHAELKTSMSGGAWKAVHVLAGSIIEALLADYLLAVDFHKGKKGPLELDLAEMIEASKDQGVIAERVVQLSTVVRGYRNLIHPGRLIRMQETVDESTAQVAKALVEMIVRDVAEKRKETYGLTAEQLVSKIEHDSSALPILNHLLRDMKPYELERFLVKVLPARYFEYLNASDEELVGPTLSSLRACFRPAFEFASDETKAKVTKNFVTIVREETSTNVLGYEDSFFRASDLAYLNQEDAMLIKQHVLSRFYDDRSVTFASFKMVFEGIGKYLAPDEAGRFAGAVCAALWRGKLPLTDAARSDYGVALGVEYDDMSDEARARFDKVMKQWEKAAAERGQERLAEELQALDWSIPF